MTRYRLNSSYLFHYSMYLKTFNRLQELPQSTTELFIHNEHLSLFLSRKWFELYENYFLTPQKSIFIVVFDDANQAIILLLLQKQQNLTKKLISVSNFYSAYFSLLIKKNLSLADLECAYLLIIHDYLLTKKIHLLEIKPILLSSIENQLLVKLLKKNHFIVDEFYFFANWTYRLEGINYKKYFNQLPSKLKNTINRKTRKLLRESSYHIEIYSAFEDIKKHISSYEKIYQLSWKKNEASAKFIRQFMLDYAHIEQTRLGIASINGQVVACQFWLVHNKTALIYKLAYDPNYKKYSIGSILTAKMMQHTIDIDGVKKIDYLTGDDAYKKDWMNKREEFCGFIAYNKKTFYGYYLGKKFQLKQFLNKQLIQYRLKNKPS